MKKICRILHIPSATLWYSSCKLPTRSQLVNQLDIWRQRLPRHLEIHTRLLASDGPGPTIDRWDFNLEQLSIVEVESETCGRTVGDTVFLMITFVNPRMIDSYTLGTY